MSEIHSENINLFFSENNIFHQKETDYLYHITDSYNTTKELTELLEVKITLFLFNLRQLEAVRYFFYERSRNYVMLFHVYHIRKLYGTSKFEIILQHLNC